MKNRFIILFLLVLIFAGCSDSQGVHTTNATTTTTPGSITPANGPATLGSDIKAFIARYGQPNNHSVLSSVSLQS